MILVIAGVVFMYLTEWGDESAWGGSAGKGVKILGKIEGGFPTPKAPKFSLSEIQVRLLFHSSLPPLTSTQLGNDWRLSLDRYSRFCRGYCDFSYTCNKV
jgi:hypothetical protein